MKTMFAVVSLKVYCLTTYKDDIYINGNLRLRKYFLSVSLIYWMITFFSARVPSCLTCPAERQVS